MLAVSNIVSSPSYKFLRNNFKSFEFQRDLEYRIKLNFKVNLSFVIPFVKKKFLRLCYTIFFSILFLQYKFLQYKNSNIVILPAGSLRRRPRTWWTAQTAAAPTSSPPPGRRTSSRRTRQTRLSVLVSTIVNYQLFLVTEYSKDYSQGNNRVSFECKLAYNCKNAMYPQIRLHITSMYVTLSKNSCTYSLLYIRHT